LLVVAGSAHAENPRPYSTVSTTLSGMVREDHSGGAETSAIGTALELAIGSGRFQYFAEGSYAGISGGGDGDGGSEVRGGGGIRWLARSFEIGHAALEMHLEGVAGYTRMSRDVDGMTVVSKYPDLGFGVGWAVRVRDPRVVIRMSARAVFAQTSRDQASECRGACDASSSAPGFVLLFGLGY
jgi:hypothetical protein